FDEAVAWYDDIARLADERPDLLMVLKPSKADWYFVDPTFQWSHPRGAAVLERWERLRAHPRVHFAGHDGDPASVVAAADLTVTFCYSSPTAEALGALGSTARYMTATAVSMALPFATLPIMTRWLTPADYGIVALAQVVAALFMGVSSLGLAAGLDRGFFKYEADARAVARLMHSGLLTVTVVSAILGTVLVAVSAPLAERLYGDTRWASLLVVMALT